MRVIAIALTMLLLFPLGIYMQFIYPEQAIQTELAEASVTDVELSWRMFSGTIFTRCNHEDATIRSYTGLKDGHYVQGVACYAPFWGATHFEG